MCRVAGYQTSVPFSSYEDGYACMKIPVLLATAAGTLLASVARRDISTRGAGGSVGVLVCPQKP